MKSKFRALGLLGVVLGALLLSSLIPSRQAYAHGAAYVDVNLFYNTLSPYGNWVDHPDYGRVWYPNGVSTGWRPYTDGHWEWTLDYGWLWVSDWEWGWAPFHYGRWAWDAWYGWVWVPGQVWAPAWVFWRYGGGYSAWAPMPPTAIWQPGYGLVTHHFDYSRDLYPDCWVGVRDHDFHRHDLYHNIIGPNQMSQVFNVTQNVKNLTIVNNHILNHGVPIKHIEQATGRTIQPVRVRELERFEPRGHHQNRDEIDIVRPRIKQPTREDLRQEEQRAVRLAMESDTRSRERSSEGDRTSRKEDYQPRIPERFRDNRANLRSEPGNRDVNDHQVDPKDARLRENSSENMEQRSGDLNNRESAPRVLEVPARGGDARGQSQRSLQSPPDQLVPDSESPRERSQSERAPAMQQHLEQGGIDAEQSRRNDAQRLRQAQPSQNQPEIMQHRQGQGRDEAFRQQQLERQGEVERQQLQEQRQMQQQREILQQREERSRQQSIRQQQDVERQQQQQRMQQQQMETQRQQAEQEERVRQEAGRQQQMYQQREMERRQQEEIGRQQQMEMQQRQQAEHAERARQEAQMQQREMERQQQMQMQRQMEAQQRQQAEHAERARQEAMRQQQHEMERHQQMQMQRQMEMQQRQQAEQMQRQQMQQQQQEMERQQQMQMQRQMEMQQRQQAEQAQRTRQENAQRQQHQQQETSRQGGRGQRNN